MLKPRTMTLGRGMPPWRAAVLLVALVVCLLAPLHSHADVAGPASDGHATSTCLLCDLAAAPSMAAAGAPTVVPTVSIEPVPAAAPACTAFHSSPVESGRAPPPTSA